VRRSSYTSHVQYDRYHRFEHWYRDNSVYFITARCREQFPAFESEQAKSIFWERFQCHTSSHGFVPWVTSLMNNHYHTIGYLKDGEQLGPMMRKIHGSIAKLVNDVLPVRQRPFWRRPGNHDYFDACIRNAKQGRRAYRYTLLQSVRHELCKDYREYSNTRVYVEMDRAIDPASELNAWAWSL
jgi:hypothetical protein